MNVMEEKDCVVVPQHKNTVVRHVTREELLVAARNQLEVDYGKSLEVVTYYEEPTKAQGFVSLILRITATVKIGPYGDKKENEQSQYQQLYFIAKCPHRKRKISGESHTQDIDETTPGVSERELDYFRTAVPLLLNRCPMNLPIVRPYNVTNQLILMEDLNALGYRQLTRNMREVAQDPLDLAHMRVVIQGLARLHAASADTRWLDVMPSCSTDSVLERATPFALTWFPKARQAFADLIISNHPNHANRLKYASWLRSDKPKQVLTAISKATPADGQEHELVGGSNNRMNVLCHGDCWVTNMLFKYDKAKNNHPIGVKFIDFDSLKFAPISRDIQYLLYLCTDKAFRARHELDLLRLYTDTFNTTLAECPIKQKCPNLSVEQLVQDYESSRIYGILFAMVLRCMNIMPDLYPDDHGKPMTEEQTQNLISGKHFDTLNYHCEKSENLKKNVSDIIQEFIEFLDKNQTIVDT